MELMSYERTYICNANGDWWTSEGKADVLHFISESALIKAMETELGEPITNPCEHDKVERFIRKYGRTTTVHHG